MTTEYVSMDDDGQSQTSGQSGHGPHRIAESGVTPVKRDKALLTGATHSTAGAGAGAG